MAFADVLTIRELTNDEMLAIARSSSDHRDSEGAFSEPSEADGQMA